MLPGAVAGSGSGVPYSRFYLPSSGSAPVSPSFGSLWEATLGTRYPLSKTPTGTALTSVTVAEAVNNFTGYDVMHGQFVSTPLLAQTISGSFSIVLRGLESTAVHDSYLQVRVALYSNDGLTLRGDLYAGQATATFSSTTTDPNYEFGTVLATRILAASLTPQVASLDDRIVVELGARSHDSNISRSCTLEFGDPAVADHALAVNVTAALRPWVEFSNPILFAS